MKKSFVLQALSGLLLLSATEIQASGFGVKLNSTQLGGQAFSGSGVSTDPLAGFNNPAAIILSRTHEIAGQTTFVMPYAKFKSDAGPDSRQAAIRTPVPSFGFTAKLHDRVNVNLVVSNPFGLKFEYGNKTTPTNLRNYAIKATMETPHINPNISVRATDYLTVGAGFQAMRAEVRLEQAVVGNQLLLDELTYSQVKGNDWGYGWTAGLLLEPIKAWKMGLSYRSKISTTLKGNLKFFNVPQALAAVPTLQNNKARAGIKFPDTYTISTSFDVNPQWTLLADAVYTGWNTIKAVKIISANSAQNKTIEQLWKGKWFFSLGANYKYNDCWLFRGGVAYDISPTKKATRIPGIPDSDKVWTGIGATYTFTKNASVSISYGHEFFRKARIHQTSSGALDGKMKSYVDLVGVQFNYKL